MPTAILLFAKAPVPGRVKTRLIGPLTTGQAASLHRAFVNDMLRTVQYLSARATIELHTDIATDAWSAAGVASRLQTEGTLELKMVHALTGALDRGFSQAMVVGTDAPTLPAAHLEAVLERPEDVAFGPCEDGGYYAIAARRTTPEMLQGVAWSTDQALQQSIAAVTRTGLTAGIGPQWWDVDTPEDLVRLSREPLSGAAGAWFRENEPLVRLGLG